MESFLVCFFKSKNIHSIYFLLDKACDMPQVNPERLRLTASGQNCRCHFLSGTEIIWAEATSSLAMVISISVLSAPFVILPFPHTWHHQLPGKLRPCLLRYWLSSLGHAYIMVEVITHDDLLLFSFSIYVSWELTDTGLNFFAASESAWFEVILNSSLWSWHLKYNEILW